MTPKRAQEIAENNSPIGWEDTVASAILAAVEEDRAARVALPDAEKERLAAIREQLKDTETFGPRQITVKGAEALTEHVRWLLDLAENLSAVLSDLLQDKGVDLLIASAKRREADRFEKAVRAAIAAPGEPFGSLIMDAIDAHLKNSRNSCPPPRADLDCTD